MANNALLDLNNPVFQQSLFALQKPTQLDVIRSLKKISQMTWPMIQQDKGLRWEKISRAPLITHYFASISPKIHFSLKKYVWSLAFCPFATCFGRFWTQ